MHAQLADEIVGLRSGETHPAFKVPNCFREDLLRPAGCI